MGHFYTTGLKECLDGTIDLDTDELKVMLLEGDTYTPNKAHTYVDVGGANDPIDAELDCVGYTPGVGEDGSAPYRQIVTVAIAANLTLNRVELTLTDLTWPTVASGHTITRALLIKEGVADTTSRLIAFIDLGDQVTDGGDVVLDFLTAGSGGNLRISC